MPQILLELLVLYVISDLLICVASPPFSFFRLVSVELIVLFVHNASLHIDLKFYVALITFCPFGRFNSHAIFEALTFASKDISLTLSSISTSSSRTLLNGAFFLMPSDCGVIALFLLNLPLAGVEANPLDYLQKYLYLF